MTTPSDDDKVRPLRPGYVNPGRVDPPGGGGDDGGVEARVAKLETAMQQVQTDLAVIKSNYATKEDLAKLEVRIAESKNSVIMWVVSAIFLAQLLPALLKKFGL